MITNYLDFSPKVKLLRYPAQGTGISVVVRDYKLFSLYKKLNYIVVKLALETVNAHIL